MTVNPLRAQPRDVAHPRASSSPASPPRSLRARHRRSARPMLACAAACALAFAARADKYWVGGDGSWTDLTWSTTPGGPPGSPPSGSDSAFIVFNDPVTRTVTYASPSTALHTLELDNTGGGTSVLSQTQGEIYLFSQSTPSLIVGGTGRGELDLLGGMVDGGGTCSVGEAAGSSGTMTIRGGTFSISTVVGDAGQGAVAQTAGNVGGSSWILGNLAGSMGAYSISGTAAAFSPSSLIVGQGGQGSFSQSAGITTVSGSMTIGAQASSSGTVSLSGGTLSTRTLTLTNGTFTQSGGSFTASMAVNIVGGSFVQSGGAFTTTGNRTVAITGGTYTQSGGQATVGPLYVSSPSPNAFTLSAGTLNVSNIGFTNTSGLQLNGALATTGTFSLAGSNGSSFTLAGGSLTTQTLAMNGSDNDLFIMTGGSLTGTSTDTYNGSLISSGSFVQTGGTATFGALTLGSGNGPAGAQPVSYSMGSGAKLVVTSGIQVGNGTVSASFDQGGGSVQASSLTIGSFGAPGTYAIGPGGSLTLSRPAAFPPPSALTLQNGTYTQTGGSAVVSSITTSSYAASPSPSSLVLAGGSLTSTGTAEFDATTSVLQSGGTFHVGKLLLDPYYSSPVNNYTLGGNGTLQVDGNFYAYNTAFLQASGSTTIGGTATADLGTSMTVKSGSFTVTGPLVLQSSGVGGLQQAASFTQTGGTVRAASLMVGNNEGWIGGVAAYTLSGGSLWATNGTSYVGSYDDPCTFVQTGGAFTANSLVVGGSPSSPPPPGSSYSLSGGTLHVLGNLDVGLDSSNGVGTYSQVGGSATIDGTLTIHSSYSSGAESTLAAGTLMAASVVNNGDFIYSGGTLNTPVFVNNRSLTLSGFGFDFPQVLNSGIVHADSANLFFTGAVTNNAAYVSSATDNHFATLTNGPAAYLQGGAADHFRLTGDLLSSSTNAANWQTTAAILEFQPNGTGSHTLSVTGADDGGANLNGYANNFAWGTLQLDAGQSLALQDGNAAPGGALYVDVVSLAGGLSQINGITGNGLDIYYNAADPANAYLGGQTYPLLNGGFLIGAVPEPTGLAAGLILGASATLRRRRRRRGP